MRLWPYYRVRKGNWFLDERPKKKRKWPRNLGTLLLVAYSLFMTADWIYRTGAETGYDKGRIRGYQLGKEQGIASVTCPTPWDLTVAAPSIID